MSFRSSLSVGVRSNENSASRNVLHQIVGSFDDDPPRGVIDAKNWKWTLSDWSKLLPSLFLIFPFDPKENVIVGLTFVCIVLLTVCRSFTCNDPGAS